MNATAMRDSLVCRWRSSATRSSVRVRPTQPVFSKATSQPQLRHNLILGPIRYDTERCSSALVFLMERVSLLVS